MPCTNGGPATYLTFAAYDHRGYKGDFLTIRELRGGELHFRGYYRPQWPSNTDSPLLGEGRPPHTKGRRRWASPTARLRSSPGRPAARDAAMRSGWRKKAPTS